MQQLNFDIYPDRANAVKAILLDDGVPINHQQLARVKIWVGKSVYDSDVTPALFDLSNVGYLVVKLGAASPAITPARYLCKLVIYDDGEYINGYVWPIQFTVTVSPEPGPT